MCVYVIERERDRQKNLFLNQFLFQWNFFATAAVVVVIDLFDMMLNMNNF